MTNITISDKATILGSIIYMVSNNFNRYLDNDISKEHIGRLMNVVKDRLSIKRGQDETEYKKLLEKALELTNEVKDNLVIDGIKIDPVLSPIDIVSYINFRYKEIAEELGLTKDMIVAMYNTFGPSGCSLNNVIFVNRLLESLEKRYENA